MSTRITLNFSAVLRFFILVPNLRLGMPLSANLRFVNRVFVDQALWIIFDFFTQATVVETEFRRHLRLSPLGLCIVRFAWTKPLRGRAVQTEFRNERRFCDSGFRRGCLRQLWIGARRPLFLFF